MRWDLSLFLQNDPYGKSIDVSLTLQGLKTSLHKWGKHMSYEPYRHHDNRGKHPL